MFDVASFTQHITNVFTSVQEKTKKGTSDHIKEIQAFQKYFELPTNLMILDEPSEKQ